MGSKNNLWILLIIVLIAVGGFLWWQFVYIGSQAYYEKLTEVPDTYAMEIYRDYTAKKCGIWVDRPDELGRDNDKVVNCFVQARETCESAMFLVLKVDGAKDVQAALQTAGMSAQEDNCQIKNTYIQQEAGEVTEQWINTCERLRDPLHNSCRPVYLTTE